MPIDKLISSLLQMASFPFVPLTRIAHTIISCGEIKQKRHEPTIISRGELQQG
jgi:hypothetical protein